MAADANGRVEWLELHPEIWEKLVHDRRRTLVWIRFYVELLDDPAMLALDWKDRALADRLLLVAARTQNRIPAASIVLARIVAIPAREVKKSLLSLQSVGYIVQRTASRNQAEMAQQGQESLDVAQHPASIRLAQRREEEESPLPPDTEDAQNTRRRGTRADGSNPRSVARAQAAATSTVEARLRRSILTGDLRRLPADELEHQIRSKLDDEAAVVELLELARRPAAPEPEL